MRAICFCAIAMNTCSIQSHMLRWTHSPGLHTHRGAQWHFYPTTRRPHQSIRGWIKQDVCSGRLGGGGECVCLCKRNNPPHVGVATLNNKQNMPHSITYKHKHTQHREISRVGGLISYRELGDQPKTDTLSCDVLYHRSTSSYPLSFGESTRSLGGRWYLVNTVCFHTYAWCPPKCDWKIKCQSTLLCWCASTIPWPSPQCACHSCTHKAYRQHTLYKVEAIHAHDDTQCCVVQHVFHLAHDLFVYYSGLAE